MRKITDLTGRLGNQMFQFAYLYSQVRRGEIPDYYLQSEEYFADFRDEIRKIYSENIPAPLDYVSIHVRRGDYVGNNFHVDNTKTGYYERAMAEFPGEKFMVFSDDIAWCKEQPIFKDCVFSEGTTELEDMNTMAACKGHIITNSSFSWWGAWLGNHKTVAPKDWYHDGIERTVLPTSWLIV